MSKKVKLVVITVCCLAVIGFCVDLVHYVFSRYVQETNDTIAKLEQEVVSANEKADQAVTKAEDTKKKLKEADAQIADLQKENKELEEVATEVRVASEITETPMATPEPTSVVTETPGPTPEVANNVGQGYITTGSFIGRWQDTWSKRASMDITMVDGKLHFYVQWANSAADGVIWKFISDEGFDPEYVTISYYGSRYEWNEQHPIEDPEQRSSDEHGVFKFENGYLHWYDNSDYSNCNCIFEKIADQ